MPPLTLLVPQADLHALLPEIFMCSAAFALLMVDLFLAPQRRGLVHFLALLILVGAAVLTALDMPYSSRPDASAPSTKYFIAASDATALSRSIATRPYELSASSSRPRYTVTRLPAEIISIMPSTANSASA
jgi:NADH:ubiquinone oxidoreductase subunit 2 (subunit N)